MREEDFGKRAGLFNSKKIKKRRRALRSGMGNDEDDYGDDYDSEEDYDSELEFASVKDEDDEEDSYYDEEDDDDDEEVDSKGETRKGGKKKRRATDAKTKAQLDMLESLAMEMKKQKDIMEEE